MPLHFLCAAQAELFTISKGYIIVTEKMVGEHNEWLHKNLHGGALWRKAAEYLTNKQLLIASHRYSRLVVKCAALAYNL